MSDSDGRDRITQLEATVRRLEESVADLLVEMEARRPRRGASMRADLRCPACGGRRIFRAKRVADRDGGREQPMALSMTGLFFPEARGIFGCDVCAACGLVEWHVDDPHAIDLEHAEIEVIEIDDDVAGPYR